MVLLGYYPDWREDFPPARVPYARYSHLAHAFALVGPRGTLTPPHGATEFCRRARAAKTIPLLAVGGAESGAAFLAAPIEPLADAIVRLTQHHGYAGVDIDWEFPDQPGAPARLVALAKALRQRLRPELLLTAAIPATAWYGKHYDAPALLPWLSWANLMAYDFAGPWSAEAGHNAPLPSCKAALRYWLEERRWPSEKLLMGLPAYGRGFRAPRFGEKTTGKSAFPEVAYTAIAGMKKAGWVEHFDVEASVPYLVSPDGKEHLSFDNPGSIQKKAAQAKAVQLRGCFFWEVSEDDGSLAAAAQKAWR